MSDVEEIPVQEPVPEEGLHRSTVHRKLGGVAGGIGERFEIDANIVRVVFVVLTCLWGLGAAIYLAMWALVPASGTTYASNDELPDESRAKRFGLRSIVLIAAALCVGLIFVSVALGGPGFGKGISLAWLVFLVVLAVLSLRRPVRRLSFTRLIAGLFIGVLSIVILASGALLAYVSSAGTPVSGGIGQRIYEPTSLSEVHRTYRLAIGKMTIDLRDVSFAQQTVSVTATVAAGDLTIEVPPGVRVNLVAQSGSNHINYPFGERSFFVNAASTSALANLNLKVGVGIGTINFYRGAPGAWLPGQ
jgi:phage shock protein PspC (stress-responsive transcriptional regulator)/predicted membrane protein